MAAALWLRLPADRATQLTLALSPQECITECQSRQTDCIQDCDGHVSCEKECVHSGEGCVARCRHGADADAGPPAAPPARPHP